MEKICFLATDQVMKNKIEQALWNHTKEPDSMPIDVAILDFNHIFRQARDMIKEGAQILIASGGTYQELAPVIREVPVLRLYISTYDIMYALEQARKYKKIYLLLNSSVIFESSMCPPELRSKTEIYTYKDRPNLEHLVDSLDVGPDIAIVGTAILPRITNIPLPIFTIMPSNPTIFSLYQYAHDLASFNKRERQQLSLLSSVLSHVDEGIIMYDAEGTISHINKQARLFLKIREDTPSMETILPRQQGSHAYSYSNTIVEKPPYTLVLNSSPFSIDKQTRYILSIREVTQQQKMVKNIL